MIEAIKAWWARHFGHIGDPKPKEPPPLPFRAHALATHVFPDARGWWRVQLVDRGDDPIRPILLVTTGRGYKNAERALDVAHQFARGEFLPVHSRDKHGNHRLQYEHLATGKKVFNTAGSCWSSRAEAEDVENLIAREPIESEVTLYPQEDN